MMDFLTTIFNAIAEMLEGLFDAIRGMFDPPSLLA